MFLVALDMRLGQLGDEARRQRVLPHVVNAPVGGIGDERTLPRAGDADIGEAPLLLQALDAVLVE
jgi:hypothetical protein